MQVPKQVYWVVATASIKSADSVGATNYKVSKQH